MQTLALKPTLDTPPIGGGLTIETVSRTFTKLRTLGLIELPQSNCVRVVHIRQLQALATGADD